MSEAIPKFIGAMEAAGMRPVEPIAAALATGELVRFRCEGDRKNRRNGWARMYLDCIPAGTFGHWRLGINSTWSGHGDGRKLSPAEERQLKSEAMQARLRAKRELEKQQRRARSEVCEAWDQGRRADPSHAYLTAKGLKPFGVLQQGDDLLVPMLDQSWRIWNVQRIKPNGFKLFYKGARTAGLFWPHGLVNKDGRASDGPIVVAEGYATAAAIWSHGPPCGVVAAMSAKNLKATAATMRAVYPDRELIVAADDDCHLAENTGLMLAREAAQAVGARLATPQPLSHESRSQADFADIDRSSVDARIEAADFVSGGLA